MAFDHLVSPDSHLLDGLRQLLGPSGVVDPADGPGYLEEPRGKFRGRAAAILRPASTAEVAEIVRRAGAARAPIVPWGGGTGLVGGQTMTEGPAPLLLSLERMRAIRSLSTEDDVVMVEAGVTLAETRAAAAEAGRLFPLSLASEGTCRIGGNLATNAGGVGVIRYGNMRDLCLGVEAVLADGSVHHGLRSLRKDNTGYDLRHLLIGSEGTLGIITAAALRLFPQPPETASAYVAVADPAAAVRLLRGMQAALGETISAFELMSAQGLGFVWERIERVRNPLSVDPAWAVLIEVGAAGAAEALEQALGAAYEDGLVLDAALAASEAQRAELWRIREEMPTANRLIGAVASCDVSLPVGRIAAFVAEADLVVARVAPELRVNCFGHLGDGNLHYNIFPPHGAAAAVWRERFGAEVMERVHDLVAAENGSISAEHGIGRLKTADLVRYGDPAKLAAMRAIKRALDPLGILNPGVVLADAPLGPNS